MMNQIVALSLVLGCLNVPSFAGSKFIQPPAKARNDPQRANITSQEIAKSWFESLEENRFQDAQKLLDKDVLWENIPAISGVTDLIPWLGTYRGVDDALRGVGIWVKYAHLRSYQLRKLLVVGDTAIGLVHERGECIANGNMYDVDVAVILTINNGKITRYQTIWDPSPLVKAFEGSW